MADVKRSIVLSPEQDTFITGLAVRLDRSRSWVIRLAVGKLMADPAFSVGAVPTQSSKIALTEKAS